MSRTFKDRPLLVRMAKPEHNKKPQVQLRFTPEGDPRPRSWFYCSDQEHTAGKEAERILLAMHQNKPVLIGSDGNYHTARYIGVYESDSSRSLSAGYRCKCFSCIGGEDEKKAMRRKNNMKLKILAKNPEAFDDEVLDDY